MDDYRIITLKEFQEVLRLIRGAKIISLTTITEPKILSGGPKDITKVSRINAVINCDYSNSVNNQREREDKERDFIPGPRAWGTRLINLPFVSHVNKDGWHKLFLEVKVQRVLSTEYRQAGKVISYDEIKDHLYENKSNATRQGLNKEIVWRDYWVKNIVSIDIDGSGYIVKWEEE